MATLLQPTLSGQFRMLPPRGPIPAALHPVRPAGSRVSLGEVLAALSHALDLTEGERAGHTVRSCAIALRFADELALTPPERSALYYAVLLKDAGCSSNASHMSALFGSDDRLVKPRLKAVDRHDRWGLALVAARSTGVGRGVRARVRHLAAVARGGEVTRELMRIRCERGAGIALRLGFPEATAAAIRALDEHWCGRGHPLGLAGEEIPLLARIANLAQTVEAFHTAHGVDAALRMVRARRGTWFDPALADRVLRWGGDRYWWAGLRRVAPRVASGELAGEVQWLDDAGVDRIAEAFADIIDAKSPYTSRHSTNVATIAEGIAATAGAEDETRRLLRRAGLLHDIGKLGVSSAVLDKPGALTPAELAEVRRHPLHTWQILSRVEVFADFALTAALHHEKLDGSGYPWGLDARHLDGLSRMLCVADIYEALTADRPYRAGMTPAAALDLMRRDRATRLDAVAFDALAAWTARRD